MKEFYCGAVVPECSARFEAETEDAILAQVGQHAAADHGMSEVSDEVVRQVREHIREVS